MSAAVPVPPPERVRLGEVLLVAGGLSVVQAVALLGTGRSVREVLHMLCVTTIVVLVPVFCLRAVTVAGFGAGAGAAGLVLLQPAWLPPVLLGALALAVACGFSPGWSRVEAWQAQHSGATPLRPGPAHRRTVPVGRLRGAGRRLCRHGQGDRVLAALLVLAYPPLAAAGAAWFLTWTASR